MESWAEKDMVKNRLYGSDVALCLYRWLNTSHVNNIFCLDIPT